MVQQLILKKLALIELVFEKKALKSLMIIDLVIQKQVLEKLASIELIVEGLILFLLVINQEAENWPFSINQILQGFAVNESVPEELVGLDSVRKM